MLREHKESPPHTFYSFPVPEEQGGNHSQRWGHAGAAPCLSVPLPPPAPPPFCPSPGKKSPLYSQQQRLSRSVIPQAAPFYSQGRGTLAAISQAWAEPTRSSRKPVVCATSKELIHGTALSIHQGCSGGLIGGGRPFKQEDFAHSSFYLLKRGVL